jgi:hypothetical protein
MMVNAERIAQGIRQENQLLREELRQTKEEMKLRSRDRPHSGVKPHQPDPFHGGRNEDVEGFLVTLERYLKLSGVREDQWVDYAASFLKNQADKWFRVQIANYGENSRFALQFRAFKEEFLKQFKPMNALLTARDRIIQLKQTGSATAYTHRFLELKLEIHDMSEAEAKDKYMRGLKPHVTQKVRLENPTTLSEMIQTAQMFDEAVYSSRHAAGMYNRHSNAMDIDTMDQEPTDDMDEEESDQKNSEEDSDTVNAIRHRSRPQRNFHKKSRRTEHQTKPTKRMDANEKVKCMRNGLCFKCRKQGHLIRDCPTWKNLKRKAQ